jgi:hypothetical protein
LHILAPTLRSIAAWAVALGGAFAMQYYWRQQANSGVYTQAELDALNTRRKAELAAAGKPTTPEEAAAQAAGKRQ